MAVGWAFIFCQTWLLGRESSWRGSLFGAHSIDHPASHKGFSGEDVPHVSAPFHAPSIATPDFHHDLDAKLIAWNHGAPKPGALDPGEKYQLALAVLHFGEQQDSASLGHRLHDQDTRHHWEAGKVSGKERFIDGDIFDRDDALPARKVNHAVDQQERKTVREDALDIVDVQRSLGRRGGFGCRLNSVSHSVSRQRKRRKMKSEDYTVPRALKPFQKKDCMPKKALKTVPNESHGEITKRLAYFQDRKDQMVQTVRQLVETESPSDNKEAVDNLGTLLARRFEGIGGHAKFHRMPNFGDHLQVDFAGTKTGKPVLLLGHLDTVYPMGTLATMPCRVADGRLWGPGAFDMKSGIALMLHAIEALRAWHDDTLPRPVTVLLVSDEEVGSETSRRITENLAKKSAAVLVLEPSHGPKGAVKTARKGIGEYVLKVTGKAAHSGLDFEKGHSAILELARQISAISKLIDLKRGLTLNVGMVQGGTRVNVIPSEASAVLDVRVARKQDATGIDRKLRSLKPFNRKCKLEISGGINRPPMERTPTVVALYKKAAEIAQRLGWKLEEAAVGGGSDGNFTAGLGIPTLDGLGGVGEGAHATHESILISELPRRAALLAELISSI